MPFSGVCADGAGRRGAKKRPETPPKPMCERDLEKPHFAEREKNDR